MGDVNSLRQIGVFFKWSIMTLLFFSVLFFNVLIIIIILKLKKNHNVVKYESSRLDPQRKHTHIIFILYIIRDFKYVCPF